MISTIAPTTSLPSKLNMGYVIDCLIVNIFILCGGDVLPVFLVPLSLLLYNSLDHDILSQDFFLLYLVYSILMWCFWLCAFQEQLLKFCERGKEWIFVLEREVE